jgi:hypothetical protein
VRIVRNRRDLSVDLLELPFKAAADFRAGPSGVPARELHVLLDLGEREAERLRLLHRPDEPDGLGSIVAMPAGAPRGLGQ